MKKGGEELRIGVFVCHCGFNIGGVVEYAKDHFYMCSFGGLALIKTHHMKLRALLQH